MRHGPTRMSSYGAKMVFQPGPHSRTDGPLNTEITVESFGDFNAGSYTAIICSNLSAFGYDDWYLPSIDELRAIHDAGFLSGDRIEHYWSSTEQQKKVTDDFQFDEASQHGFRISDNDLTAMPESLDIVGVCAGINNNSAER